MEPAKNLIFQIMLVILISVGSSAIATQITLSVMETKMVYVESDIKTIKRILDSVTKHQVVLAERGIWMSNQDAWTIESKERHNNHNRRLNAIESCLITIGCAK